MLTLIIPLCKGKEGTSISYWQSEAHKCCKWNETKWSNLWLIIDHRHEGKRRTQGICPSPGKSVRFLLRINILRNNYELSGSVNIKKQSDLKLLTQWY